LTLIYLIIFHTDLNHLKRLIGRIKDPRVLIYIHVDAKISFSLIRDHLKGYEVNFVEKRVKINWGDFSIIQAKINFIKQLIESKIEFTHLFIISGQDYPLISNQQLFDFLQKNIGNSFLQNSELYKEHSHLSFRVNKYHFFLPFKFKFEYPYEGKRIFLKILNRFLRLISLFPIPRKIPFEKVYFGSNWVKTSYKATQFLYEYFKSNNEKIQFFKYVINCDEQFFQTILLNASEADRGIIVNESLLFSHWDRPNHLYSIPLEFADFQRISNSKRILFFARKFNSSSSEMLLEEIDKWFLK
jgi:hypothetical protein